MFNEISLIIWITFHCKFSSDISKAVTSHVSSIHRMPSAEDGSTNTCRHCDNGDSWIHPHRCPISDPDFLTGFFYIFHVEPGYEVCKKMILCGSNSRRISVDPELFKTFFVTVILMTTQSSVP